MTGDPAGRCKLRLTCLAGRINVRVYGAAKTVADCFKCRNKLGLDTAIESLRLFLKEKRGEP